MMKPNYAIVTLSDYIAIMETNGQTEVVMFPTDQYSQAAATWTALTAEAERLARMMPAEVPMIDEPPMTDDDTGEIEAVEVETAQRESDDERRQVIASLIEQGQMAADEDAPDASAMREYLRKMLPADERKALGDWSDDEVKRAYDQFMGAEKPKKASTSAQGDGIQNVPQPQRKAIGRYGDPSAIREAEVKAGISATGSYFKALGDGVWVATYTNSFEDRDKEIISESALDAYIERVEKGFTPMPELWSWHLPGTRHGVATAIFKTDKMVTAVGKFDDTDAGREAEAFYMAQKADTIRLSHGFDFPEWARTYDEAGVATYHALNTFEISTLPAGKEANPYTSFRVSKELQMLTEEKRAFIRASFPKQADAILTQLESVEATSKALVDAGVKFKDFADLTTEPVESATKQADKSAESAELLQDLIETNATVTGIALQTAEALNALAAQVKELRLKLELPVTSAEKPSPANFLDVTAEPVAKAAQVIKQKTAGTTGAPDMVSVMFPGLTE
jgi:hypothetical protein